jgi:hypothetical protein
MPITALLKDNPHHSDTEIRTTKASSTPCTSPLDAPDQ